MELTEIEKRLIECWRMANDDEKEDVAFVLRRYKMPFPDREDGTVSIYKGFAMKNHK